MREDASNTYCNPIVLPDYPKLAAKSRRQERPDWGRAGKHLLTEAEVIAEAGADLDDVQYLYKNVRNPYYGRIAENDVRATADPSVMFWDGRWYLYTSCGLMYDSDDMVHWTSHSDPTWIPLSIPMAPTVERFRGKYYATCNSTPLHLADGPLGPWTRVGEWTLPDGRETLCNDPMIFADGDRLYLYWGLGSAILGVELDPDCPNHFLTAPKVLIRFNPENWWERFGASNEDWEKGFIEGSWMKKIGDTYYLIYSASGTEYFNYCMGVYTADSPLGEFTPQKHNPISRSREGFIRGGGHGSIADGPDGTFWIFYTIPVCVDAIMERRIGMDPAGLTEDGELFALTGFDDPQFAPGVLPHPERGNGAGLIPVSIFKPTLASSYAPGHYPVYALDEAIHTWWQPAENDPAPCFAVLLQGFYDISAVRILWKDIGLDFARGVDVGPYRFVLESSPSLDQEDWEILVDASDNPTDLTVDYRTFPTVRALRVRLRITGVPAGLTPGLLEFTVFGRSAGK